MSALIVGDVHGRPRSMIRMIDQAHSQGISTILQVGDYGKAFSRTFIDQVGKHAQKRGVTVRFADGNHEDHLFLRGLPERADGAKLLTGNVLYQPRGSVAVIEGTRVMFMGGAVSVNKTYLKQSGKLWQYEEAITEMDVSAARRAGRADILICHDAPSSVELPAEVFHLEASNKIREEAQANRELLQEVVESAQPRVIYHGHYHRRMDNMTTLPSGLQIPTYGLAADCAAGSTLIETFKTTQAQEASCAS